MQRDLHALANTTFDVLVVGGGITGAAVAYDAAVRGLSVGLIERGDFGGATSAASSKLLHSGIRYLQQLRFDKVRESALERARFQVMAPHLSRFVPFLVPAYRGLLRGRLALETAAALHRLIAWGENAFVRDAAKRIPAPRFYGRTALASLIPDLVSDPDLTGALLVHEAHLVSPERATLAFVKSAAARGAVAANYVEAERFLYVQDRVVGVRARDLQRQIEFDIRARVVVNATGPWIADLTERSRRVPLGFHLAGFARGVHVVTRPVHETFALALPTKRPSRAVVHRGGRHVFVIPWRGHSLIGTTYTPIGPTLGTVTPTAEDIETLLADVNAAMPWAELTLEDVRFAYAGVYTLVNRRTALETFEPPIDSYIVDHGRLAGIEGVVSVLGARYTTARKLAQETMDLVCAKAGLRCGPTPTTAVPLVGGEIEDLTAFTADVTRRLGDRLEPAVLEYLIAHYGTEIDRVIGHAPQMSPRLRRLAPERECIEAEIEYATIHEMALTLDDVVFRRTGLGTVGHPGEACLRRAAEIMANHLGWTEEKIDAEVARTRRRFQFA